MNYPFNRKTPLSRFVSLTLVVLMMLAMLSGCSLIPGLGGSTESTTEPTETTEPNQPNIIEETETTEPPTTETTVPPTTAPKKENVAVVKEQLNLRASPSSGSRVITQLDAGDELEVIRIEPIGAVEWAYVSSDSLNIMGWIVTDMLDMSNVTISSGSTSTPGSEGTATAPTSTAPTTVTVDPVTGTGTTGTTPANSQTGTVTTNTLNIRSAASTNSERLGSYTFGDRITILETKDGWGRTDKGWVSLNYVNLGSNGGSQTPTTNPTNTGSGNAVVTGSAVNLRSGAGTSYPTVGTVTQGKSITILETTTGEGRQWGRTNEGWICMDYVSVTGSIGGTGTTGTATVTGTALNIREGAGTSFATVGSLTQGQTVSILETTMVGTTQWGRIQQGWICMDYVKMN